MRKKVLITMALALFLMGIASPRWIVAQDAPKEDETQLKTADSYKLEFSVHELDNGKRINSRSYSMLMRTASEALPKYGNVKNLRIGSKVPFSTSTGTGTTSNSIQYEDVGMNIDCRILPMANGNVVVGANWEYSSLADEDAAKHDTLPPVFRQVRMNVESVVPLNKPTVLAEMDDVASTRHYVFEVKVTKISE
jgi:hypothetical protein